MTSEQIEIVKAVGSYEAVCKKIGSVLFIARDHLDKATHECLDDFDNRIEAATELIQDALDLYHSLPATTPSCLLSPEPADD